MTTGSALPGALKKTGGASPLAVKKTAFADEIELKPIGTSGKRSPSPRLSPRPSPHIAEGRGSPVRAKSPLRGRAPKLAVIGKLGSSGFYADDEDNDNDEPEIEIQPSSGKTVTIQLPEAEENGVDHIVVPNAGAVSAGNSPFRVARQAANKQHQVTVTAEVHVNPDMEDELTPRNNITSTRVTFSEDRPTTPLIPSPETRRNRKGVRKVRAISPLSNGDSEKSKEGSDELRTSFEEESLDKETRVSRDNMRKGSLSLDRKGVLGVKELNSAFKESKKFMYHSLEDAIDYSQC